MSLVVGNLVATFDLNAKGFSSGMKQVDATTKSLSSRIAFSTAKIGAFSAALTGVGFSLLQLSKSIAGVEAIHRTMEAATGSADQAAKAWRFVESESRRLGLGLEVTASSYAKLRAAMLGTSLEAETIESIFSAVAEKGAILGLSNERIALTFLAIEQMGSKSVISMEELRRQLGENLPGALGIMARALGVSLQTLNKWVASGNLLAEDVLPLFAQQLLMENEPAVKQLGDTMQSSISGISTAWFNLKKAMSEGIVNQTLREFNKLISMSLGTLTSFINLLNTLTSFTRSKVDDFKELHKDFGKIAKDNVVVIEKSSEEIIKIEEDMAEKRQELFDKISSSVSNQTVKEVDEWKGLKEQLESTIGEFSSFVADTALGIETSFSGMLKSMAHSLIEYATQILVVKPIIEWLGNALASPGTGGGVISSLFGTFLGGFKGFAKGGIINEPIVGIGASGSGYMFGEDGPEAVIPTGTASNRDSSKNVNITINAVDSKSVTDLLRNNPQAVTTPIVEALTLGDRSLTSALRLSGV